MSLQTTSEAVQDAPKHSRIAAIDVLRGIALIAMASYHFTWDLDHFQYIEPGTTAVGGWKIYARCIASTFLFLVGVSLFLAHGRQIRWPSFWKRFAIVALAALAVTAVTFFTDRNNLIFFGILHEIALASLLGLAFLRLPAVLTAIVAAAIIAAPYYLRSGFFDHPALWWVGLSATNPRSDDYVPLFPWFGAVLAGIAVTKFASSAGLLARLGTWTPGNWSKPLTFLGRHSLAFYLIHQPLLYGGVSLYSQFWPGEAQLRQCQVMCEQTHDDKFCSNYCACAFDALKADKTQYSTQEAFNEHVADVASTCTAATESKMEGGQQ
ncbi:DUF1624 domain-containing protein [Mesorhizobium sp. WSM4884]|uniref:heparan-alpha-glucosaminide N-acetyltransferase n=1 Tax=Mesorhizobium sp. WSM4884 TaxID=3038542 RepID=UPI00241733F9|nr:DUF1624 domain-containing protein [Mesorhizobium sp. WSM4884]MDG4880071.1 DUF1624 domain-containing protein [Mesorhizobium sp. WSM4884]